MRPKQPQETVIQRLELKKTLTGGVFCFIKICDQLGKRCGVFCTFMICAGNLKVPRTRNDEKIAS